MDDLLSSRKQPFQSLMKHLSLPRCSYNIAYTVKCVWCPPALFCACIMHKSSEFHLEFSASSSFLSCKSCSSSLTDVLSVVVIFSISKLPFITFPEILAHVLRNLCLRWGLQCNWLVMECSTLCFWFPVIILIKSVTLFEYFRGSSSCRDLAVVTVLQSLKPQPILYPKCGSTFLGA